MFIKEPGLSNSSLWNSRPQSVLLKDSSSVHVCMCVCGGMLVCVCVPAAPTSLPRDSKMLKSNQAGVFEEVN